MNVRKLRCWLLCKSKWHHKHAHYVPKGRYGIIEGGTYADMACKNCPIGSFSQADGSQECFVCPAGSFCNTEKMDIYKLCSPGRYNSYSNQTECLDCPRGTYQPSEGSATCELCVHGKYLDRTGSIDV